MGSLLYRGRTLPQRYKITLRTSKTLLLLARACNISAMFENVITPYMWITDPRECVFSFCRYS